MLKLVKRPLTRLLALFSMNAKYCTFLRNPPVLAKQVIIWRKIGEYTFSKMETLPGISVNVKRYKNY